jgi:hypothetical protein
MSIAVWFEYHFGAQAGTMLGGLPSDSIVVDMNNDRATVVYDGSWRVESN